MKSITNYSSFNNNLTRFLMAHTEYTASLAIAAMTRVSNLSQDECLAVIEAALQAWNPEDRLCIGAKNPMHQVNLNAIVNALFN